MGHPDSGSIQALLDGEMEGREADELRSHVAECPACKAEKETLAAASKETARALLLLDRAPPLDSARKSIQARRRRKVMAGPERSLFSLPRAASIALLITGMAAAALPGSPVRRWLTQGWGDVTQEGAEVEGARNTDDPSTAPAPEREVPPETGVGITVPSEGMDISVHGLLPGAELRLLWTDGEEAWIHAGEGTRFNRTGGRLEAFSPPGDVRIEVPRSTPYMVVRLDGVMLLRKTGSDLEIMGPVLESTASEIRFGPFGTAGIGAPGDGGENDGPPEGVSQS